MRGHKYFAKKTEVDGITFDSQKEARRYQELRLLERAGEITRLKVQPEFPLEVNGRPVLIRSKGYPNGRRAKYVADFKYMRGTENVVEDVKGFDTPVSRLKRAIVEAEYEIEIQVI